MSTCTIVNSEVRCYSWTSLAGTPWRLNLTFYFLFPGTFSFRLPWPFWWTTDPSMGSLNPPTQQKVNPEEKGRKENPGSNNTGIFSVSKLNCLPVKMRSTAPGSRKGAGSHNSEWVGKRTRPPPSFQIMAFSIPSWRIFITKITVWHIKALEARMLLAYLKLSHYLCL